MTEGRETRGERTEHPEYWALMWREGDDWGWLCSLDGNDDCTTQEPGRRLRFLSKERAMSALWKFRSHNDKRPNEKLSVVRVRLRPAPPREPS
jgi:hypothetical protein